MLSLQQNQRTRGRNRFCQEASVGGIQTMYTYVYIVNVKMIKLIKK
jgi:hypothetical protein